VTLCVLNTVRLLVTGRLRQPVVHLGEVLHFADGTSARVYRETVVPRDHVAQPVVLVVEFRLRWVRGDFAHALFRAESLLNTPLFVGFPGFVSKLWLTHDQAGFYRGVYEWDGAELAHAYARALWWILAFVCDRDSIHYTVVPGSTRSEFLEDDNDEDRAWWRVARVAAA
jgi:hypothetical protein